MNRHGVLIGWRHATVWRKGGEGRMMRGTGAEYLWGAGLGLKAWVGALPWWDWPLLVPLAGGGAWIAFRAWRRHVVRSRRLLILARERMYREVFEFSALAMAVK